MACATNEMVGPCAGNGRIGARHRVLTEQQRLNGVAVPELETVDWIASCDHWGGVARDDPFLLTQEALLIGSAIHNPDDTLLERGPELALLCKRIAALRGDLAAGSCVLLSAEAGGGKTSLLVELARRADDGVEWLWGRVRADAFAATAGPADRPAGPAAAFARRRGARGTPHTRGSCRCARAAA